MTNRPLFAHIQPLSILGTEKKTNEEKKTWKQNIPGIVLEFSEGTFSFFSRVCVFFLSLRLGHTPKMAGNLRKKFRKKSGKIGSGLRAFFLEFPSRVRLGTPKCNNQRHVKPPEHLQNSRPPNTAGDASFFRSGSGEGPSEVLGGYKPKWVQQDFARVCQILADFDGFGQIWPDVRLQARLCANMTFSWGRTITRLTRVPGSSAFFFFVALFRPKHRKISRKQLEMAPFFSLRESQVARKSGDIPV